MYQIRIVELFSIFSINFTDPKPIFIQVVNCMYKGVVQNQHLKILITKNSYAAQIMQLHHSVVGCASNMENLTLNNFHKFRK
jgi:hypothetical protein